MKVGFLILVPRTGTDSKLTRVRLLSVESGLQFRDVQLFHFQHSLKRAVRFFSVLRTEELWDNRGNYLPGHSVFVFKPSTGELLSALGELAPEVVDFFLVFAVDHEGNRPGELFGGSVERHEFLAADAKHRDQVVAAQDFSVLEDGGVVLRGFRCVFCVKETRGDFFSHALMLLKMRGVGNRQTSTCFPMPLP
jgi:hypothetical protein